ncbi:MAG TPA: hypothetical protein VGP06_05075, partial [Janthinobacterium sp.]|nr:hypothetical protein [Janthinobacterium sp.]
MHVFLVLPLLGRNKKSPDGRTFRAFCFCFVAARAAMSLRGDRQLRGYRRHRIRPPMRSATQLHSQVERLRLALIHAAAAFPS